MNLSLTCPVTEDFSTAHDPLSSFMPHCLPVLPSISIHLVWAYHALCVNADGQICQNHAKRTFHFVNIYNNGQTVPLFENLPLTENIDIYMEE